MSNYNSMYSGAQIDDAVGKVIAAGNLAASPKIIQKTLGSNLWNLGVQSLADPSILEGSVGDFKISQTATAAEFSSFVNAQIQVTGQTNGTITVTCRGVTPAINIPVIIEVR